MVRDEESKDRGEDSFSIWLAQFVAMLLSTVELASKLHQSQTSPKCSTSFHQAHCFWHTVPSSCLQAVSGSVLQQSAWQLFCLLSSFRYAEGLSRSWARRRRCASLSSCSRREGFALSLAEKRGEFCRSSCSESHSRLRRRTLN